MNKIICPKCNTPSYTAATICSVSCPFCGFLSQETDLERRMHSKEVDSDRRMQDKNSLCAVIKKNDVKVVIPEEALVN